MTIQKLLARSCKNLIYSICACTYLHLRIMQESFRIDIANINYGHDHIVQQNLAVTSR